MSSPRKPNAYDHIAYYVAIPLLFGVLAAPFAVPPQGEVNFSVITYVCFRAVIFWVIIDVACRCIGHTLARYRLPLWSIFICGFLLAGTAIYLFFFVALQTSRFKNPDIAASIGHQNMGWNLDYALTVAGYSLPALILWFLAAYGYRRALNVELFSYAPALKSRRTNRDEPHASQPPDMHFRARPAKLLSESRLPKDSSILVIKAEEHYIRVWTDNGADLLRYRFKDAVNEMGHDHGLQVHRSWWVRLSSIDQLRTRGRKNELRLVHDDLIVPVSLSYKQALLQALEFRDNSPDFQAGDAVS